MTSGPSTSTDTNKLPWWTWVVGLLVLQTCSLISAQFESDSGILAIYLPTAIGIILVNWWGPWRVIPLVYFSGVLGSFYWNVQEIELWFLFPLPETLMIFLSWFLFTHKAQGKYWLPNIRSLLLFLTLGIIVPIIPELLFLQGFSVISGQSHSENFWFNLVRSFVGEFTSSFGISIIFLFYFSPIMERMGLTLHDNKISIKRIGLTHWQWAEVILIATFLFISVFTIEFKKFWYFYGIFSLFAAIRGGFGIAILVNFYIYFITYILPSVIPRFRQLNLKTDEEIVFIFLGIGMLYVFAAVTGRVFTDLQGVEKKLRGQFKELETANTELDRFVYSVSHDLSAPLKSILGLVNVGRVDVIDPNSKQYFTKIESSVRKMEDFIHEVLDYSRNKRLDIEVSTVKIKELLTDIWNNLKDAEGYQQIMLDLTSISEPTLVTDKIRLKIIINNLLSNAIKYQKQTPGNKPWIKISTYTLNGKFVLEIADNGEGIATDLQPLIFKMFYRGNEKSKGSGLGLYIAKEAAEKIHATLDVSSMIGEGTKFTLTFK
jgi:signal transduction histidine kinase